MLSMISKSLLIYIHFKEDEILLHVELFINFIIFNQQIHFPCAESVEYHLYAGRKKF